MWGLPLVHAHERPTIKPNQPNQPNQTKPTKPNQTKPTKPNQTNQTNQNNKPQTTNPNPKQQTPNNKQQTTTTNNKPQTTNSDLLQITFTAGACGFAPAPTPKKAQTRLERKPRNIHFGGPKLGPTNGMNSRTKSAQPLSKDTKNKRRRLRCLWKLCQIDHICPDGVMHLASWWYLVLSCIFNWYSALCERSACSLWIFSEGQFLKIALCLHGCSVRFLLISIFFLLFLWIVTFVEPAREITQVRDPELLFLHEKDYWFKAIWQDIHLAATLDRVKSRERPPVGLVRCICKDERSKGQEIQGHGHQRSSVLAMSTSSFPFGCAAPR